MKIVLKYLIGAVIGFFVTYGMMSLSEVSFASEVSLSVLLLIVFILLSMSLQRMQKIKSLNKQSFSGDDEDLAEDKKYKYFADYSLFTNVSFILSLLSLSLSILTADRVSLSIISMLLIVLSYVLLHYMTSLMRNAYPERDIPKTSDSQYAKRLLEAADDGEKHVILNGLFKSQNLLNISLIAAIVLSTGYSIAGGSSQTFSIILMAIALLVVNSNYLLVIRAKG